MSWLTLTLLILAAGLLLALLLKKLRKFLLAAVLLLAVAVTAGAAICWNAPASQGEADYAVLLGYALGEDGQPAEELVRRLELAKTWMEENQDKMLILTGGDPAGVGVTEAQAMYDWLKSRGADMSRVLLEDRANDTRQNLAYCMELARQYGLDTDTVEILTSDYHQTRARFLAEQNGQNATGLSCETPLAEHLEAAVREVYAFIKVFLETL